MVQIISISQQMFLLPLFAGTLINVAAHAQSAAPTLQWSDVQAPRAPIRAQPKKLDMPSGVTPTQILPEVMAPYNEGGYCGYRIYGPENSITEITAEWVVPKAISPTAPGTVLYHNPATQAQTPADFVSGMWIGIDSIPGKADTFIQAGTAQYLIATPLLSGHGVLGYNLLLPPKGRTGPLGLSGR